VIKNICLVLINSVFIIPVGIYISLAFTLSFLFKLTYNLFHICHLTSASKYQEAIPDFLNPIELFWLYNSDLISSSTTKNCGHATGASILFIEGPISKSNLKNLIRTRIISTEQRLNQRFLVRFRQRLYNIWAYGYVWLDCDEATFDLDKHIFDIEDPSNSIKTESDLQAYVSGLIAKNNFNIRHPLWKIYVKHNFQFADNECGTVLVFLSHMCFADGVSLIRVLFKTLVDNRNAVDIKPRFAHNNFKLELVNQFFFRYADTKIYML